ncbi:MAG: hypothetical protein WCG27_09195, partial [Pseudomonadota bacterium]
MSDLVRLLKIAVFVLFLLLSVSSFATNKKVIPPAEISQQCELPLTGPGIELQTATPKDFSKTPSWGTVGYFTGASPEDKLAILGAFNNSLENVRRPPTPGNVREVRKKSIEFDLTQAKPNSRLRKELYQLAIERFAKGETLLVDSMAGL